MLKNNLAFYYVKICCRFGNLMEFAVDFITENEPTANGPDETEENFMFSIVHSLMAELQVRLDS